MVDAYSRNASAETTRLRRSGNNGSAVLGGCNTERRAEFAAVGRDVSATCDIVAVPRAFAGAFDLPRLPLRHRHIRLRLQANSRLLDNCHQGLCAAVHRVRYFRGNEAPSDSISDSASSEPGRRRSRHHQDRPSHRLRIRQASHFRLGHEPRRHALQAKPLHNLDHHPVEGFVAPASRRLFS